MQDDEDKDHDDSEKLRPPPRHATVDHGHNVISVGDDPLLKRLIAKHGDRSY